MKNLDSLTAICRLIGRRLQDFHLYQFFIQLAWPTFFAVVLAAFLALTLVFTALYFAAGIGGLQGIPEGPPAQNFLQVFFFSVQTLTTVGYGSIALRGIGANVVASIEATVVLVTVEGTGREARRVYAKLELERSAIFFLPLTWTVVHPIDPSSPLAVRSPPG